MENTTKPEVKKPAVEAVSIIDTMLEVLELVELGKVDLLGKEEDTIKRRVDVSKYLLTLAHKEGKLLRIKSTDTMRELLYNLIAIDTQKSKDFHKGEQAKAADSIKDILASKKASAIFNIMYAKQFKAIVK